MNTVSAIALVIDVLLVALAMAKGKFILAILGLFIPLVGLVAAIRLAKPDSWWAENRYDDSQRRRAAERFEKPVPA